MLRHVAQSVGGALPGNVGIGVAVSQVYRVGRLLEDVVVPADAQFCFAELVGHGGEVSGAGIGGGGAGNDTILPVLPGDIMTFDLTHPSGGFENSTISLNGQVVLVAAGATGANSNQQEGPGASGKYPGETGRNVEPTIQGGRGGGRLSGRTVSIASNRPRPAPPGSGVRYQTTSYYGGSPAGCLTFFTDREAAVVFANAAYGGNWRP